MRRYWMLGLLLGVGGCDLDADVVVDAPVALAVTKSDTMRVVVPAGAYCHFGTMLLATRRKLVCDWSKP